MIKNGRGMLSDNWVNCYYREQFGNVNHKGFIYNKKTEVSKNGRGMLSDN